MNRGDPVADDRGPRVHAAHGPRWWPPLLVAILVLPASVCFVFAAPAVQPRSPGAIRPAASMEEARRLYEGGRYGEAARVLSAVIRSGDSVAEAHKLRGKAQEKLGAHAAASKDFIRYCQLKPGDLEGLTLKAEALLGAGDFEGAVEGFAEVIRLAPSRVQAYQGRGLALTALDRYDDAVKDFAWVLRHKPDDQDALVNMGRACMLGNRPMEAAAYLNRCLKTEKDPKWAEKIRAWLADIAGESAPSPLGAPTRRWAPREGTRRLW